MMRGFAFSPTPFPHAMRHLILALALIPAALAPAHAATKPKEGSFGKGSGAFLTKEQLRGCLGQQARIKQADAELLKDQAALNAQKDDIARRGDALNTQLATLDRADAPAVDAYNALAEARDKLIDEYQAGVDPFNTRVEARTAEREAFSKACDNKRYFEEDETAIRKGR